MSKFTNPYTNCRKTHPGRVIRVGADIPTDDFMAIKVIRPAEGTVTTLISLMWKKILNECRLRGITDFSKLHNFERLVAECRLLLPEEYLPNPAATIGSSASGLHGSAVAAAHAIALAPDDGGATPGTGPVHSGTPTIPPNVQSKGTGGGGARRINRAKGKS